MAQKGRFDCLKEEIKEIDIIDGKKETKGNMFKKSTGRFDNFTFEREDREGVNSFRQNKNDFYGERRNNDKNSSFTKRPGRFSNKMDIKKGFTLSDFSKDLQVDNNKGNNTKYRANNTFKSSFKEKPSYNKFSMKYNKDSNEKNKKKQEKKFEINQDDFPSL